MYTYLHLKQTPSNLHIRMNAIPSSFRIHMY